MTTDQENGAGRGVGSGDAGERGRIAREISLWHWEGFSTKVGTGLGWSHPKSQEQGTVSLNIIHHFTKKTETSRKRSCSPVPPLVVKDWGEERDERVVEENGRGNGQGHWMTTGQHYWSMGADNDQEFRMRSASKVVCFSPALLAARMLAWNRQKSWFNQAQCSDRGAKRMRVLAREEKCWIIELK